MAPAFVSDEFVFKSSALMEDTGVVARSVCDDGFADLKRKEEQWNCSDGVCVGIGFMKTFVMFFAVAMSGSDLKNDK